MGSAGWTKIQRFWVGGRQTLPYRITSELPVIPDLHPGSANPHGSNIVNIKINPGTLVFFEGDIEGLGVKFSACVSFANDWSKSGSE
jgi:hypothetical protein